ncbi:hypothetical protein R3P38DRAFT_3123855 [Favolaschia claudopus]|uniref:F-box domain-containing protein n=1 Tax=Favolaschia claudopus TaxID=2862362 RepID=A0AAV9ZC46_9AGAR
MDSPFASRLGTNYCPTDDEVLEIREFIAEPTRQILALDNEIAQLRGTIEKLEKKRKSLNPYVEAHQALISPMRRISQDVLSEIFIACLPTHRNCVMSASEAPLLLGRVCSSWRTLSLATPRLWASLHVVERSLSYDVRTIRLEAIKMWLGRSGQRPLSISLHSGDYMSLSPSSTEQNTGTLPPDGPESFLNELVPFADRWQHVRFLAARSVIQGIVHLTADDTPLLESVSFTALRDHPGSDLQWPEFGMLQSPGISSFSTNATEFRSSTPLRWHLLTELSIGGSAWESPLDAEVILTTLARCPLLQVCKFAVNALLILSSTLLHPTVELPLLHTLQLDFGNLSSSCLLERLSLPDLRKFVIRGHVDSLASFLASCTRLESLDLDAGSPDKSSLLEGLGALSDTVHHLTIRDRIRPRPGPPAGLDDDALAMLSGLTDVPEELSQSRCRCPSLQSLTVIGCTDISDLALQQFIEGRMALGSAGSSLKRVRAQFTRGMKEDVKPLLKRFVDAGLDLNLIYLPPPFSTYGSPWEGLEDAPSPWGPAWTHPIYW